MLNPTNNHLSGETIMKRILLSKTFIIGVSAVVIYTLVGFFLVPFLVQHYVPKIVREDLNKQASIGVVRFNPYIFTFEANDFRLDEPDGQAIAALKRLFIDFELKSLFNWAWTFKEVSIDTPLVKAVISSNGDLNLAKLAPASDPQPPQENQEPMPRLIIEQISIRQGQVFFTDRQQSEAASLTLTPLDLKIENLTTLPNQKGVQTITATSSDGETLRWTGNVSLNPVETQGTLKLENIRTATLWKFVRDGLNLEPPLGTLNMTGDYSVDLGKAEPKVSLTNLAVKITGVMLRLAGDEEAFLELPDVRISEVDFDLGERQAAIGKLLVAGGRARLAVDEKGEFNLQRVVKAPSSTSPAPSAPEGPVSETWKVRLESLDLEKLALDYRDLSRDPGLNAGIEAIALSLKATVEAGGNLTRASVNDIGVTLSGLRAGLTDTTKPAVRIGKVALAGGAYDLALNTLTVDNVSIDGGDIDLKREADGKINLVLLAAPPEKGAIALEPREAAVEGHPFRFLIKTVAVSGLGAAFSDISVKPVEPILNLEDIGVALTNVDGKSPMKFEAGLKIREGGQIRVAGTVDPSLPSVDAEVQLEELSLKEFQPYVGQSAAVILTSGAFSTRGSLRHGLKASGAKTLYQGGFKLDNLRVVEPSKKETLVGWKTVQTDQLRLQLATNGLEIGDLRVVGPAGKFIIEKDRSLNLANVVKPDPEPKKSPPAAGAADPFPYRVRRVLVSDGRVDFADLSLITPFGTKVHELKGNLAGISSTRDARTQVKLDGRVDEYGTARIEGELNTSDPKAFTDISVMFRNVEMSNLTPYSGKFAGRKINSGKLTVDLKYKIDQSRLAGDNQIVVESLKLGEKVASPEAVDLPLDFAIALLEDTKGVIDLGLPVSGNLDSPEFSYGALIGKAIVNLLTKIVTSPFRALGALLPGGSEESFKNVAFEPGRSDVPPPEKEKLNKLAGALLKRPQLKLTVQGRYNPETDRAELRNASLRLALAVRQGLKLKPQEDPGPVDFSSPGSGKVLEAMFSERFGAETLKTLQAEMKVLEDKAKKESAAKAGAASSEDGTIDPGRLAKILFARLADAEAIGEPELSGLADARARAIAAELSGPGGIPAIRVEVISPAALDKNDLPTAALNLDAAR